MRIISISLKEAKALSNSRRIEIMNILQKEKTVEQICKKLNYKKNDTTIRQPCNNLTQIKTNQKNKNDSILRIISKVLQGNCKNSRGIKMNLWDYFHVLLAIRNCTCNLCWKMGGK